MQQLKLVYYNFKNKKKAFGRWPKAFLYESSRKIGKLFKKFKLVDKMEDRLYFIRKES